MVTEKKMKKQEKTTRRREIQQNNNTKIVREAHRISWDNFISQIEQDVHGRQNFTYKFLKNFNRSEKDDARIDVIEDTEWINHYKNLWYQENTVQTNWDNTNLTTTDLITIEELQEALKQLKNRKASEIDKLILNY